MDEDRCLEEVQLRLRAFLPSLRGVGYGTVEGAPSMTDILGDAVVEEYVVADVYLSDGVTWFDYLLVWRTAGSDKFWTMTWVVPIPTGTEVDDVIGVMVS